MERIEYSLDLLRGTVQNSLFASSFLPLPPLPLHFTHILPLLSFFSPISPPSLASVVPVGAGLAHPSLRTSDLPFKTSDVLSTRSRLSQIELDFQLGLVIPLPSQDACED